MKKINFANGKVIVTDPCYSLSTWCTKVVVVKKGDYIMSASIRDEGDWGKRIGCLMVNHIDYQDILPDDFIGNVGVDSGQCGFFDYEYYKKYHKGEYVDDNEEDNQWYKRVCKITLDKPCYGIIDNMGCVSESGYGDGGYSVYAGYNSENEIVSLMIVYIYDEDEEIYNKEEDEEEDF